MEKQHKGFVLALLWCSVSITLALSPGTWQNQRGADISFIHFASLVGEHTFWAI